MSKPAGIVTEAKRPDAWIELDFFSFHVFGFCFNCADNPNVRVNGMVAGWELFKNRVFEEFSNIDQGRIDEAQRVFPGEATILCWTRA